MTKLKYFFKRQCGATVVEFALIAPIFIFTLLAVFDFGYRYYIYSTIEKATFSVASKLRGTTARPTSSAAVKQDICATVGRLMKCNQNGFFVSVQPLTATSPSTFTPTADAYSIVKGQPAIIQIVYPLSSIVPMSALRSIGFNTSNWAIKTTVFFQVL